MKKTLLGVVVIAALTAATLALLEATEPDLQPRLRAEPPARVEVAPVERRTVRPVETVVGRLEPVRRANLRFEVAGQVAERAVEPGQRVEQGALLLRLQDGDFRDAVAEAAAQLAIEREGVARDRQLLTLAEEQMELQAGEVRRLERLGADSLVARSQLDEARQRLVQLRAEVARLRHSVDTAQARVALRRAALDRAQRNLDRTRLRAPFAGVVNDVAVQVGDYVSSNQPALELLDLDALELHLEVRAAVAAAQELGAPVTVQTEDGPVEGRIVALQRHPDPSTFTYGLRVRVSGGETRSGRIARARLFLPRLEDVLTVPAASLVYDEGAAYVLTVEQGRLRRVPVRLGPRVGDDQVVYGELSPGGLIVARDAAALAAGQQVRPVQPAGGP